MRRRLRADRGGRRGKTVTVVRGLPGGDPSSRISNGVSSEFAGVVIIADAGCAHLRTVPL